VSDYDPRLVALYDEDNPDGPDHDYYRALADEHDAAAILDLGCGTGILTVTLTRPGRTVVGIDPSPRMLEYASDRPGGSEVQWILGDSREIPSRRFDYAVMTGNVAQHIGDPDWERTLAGLRAALVQNGVLAFESRNPAGRAWEGWNHAEQTVRQTTHGPVRQWSEAREVIPGRVILTSHNDFEAAGESVLEELTLSFREREQIEQQLIAAGFELDGVWRNWDRAPFVTGAALMVFEAHAA
jgi:SAM-dependent methyltransferase